MNQHLTNWQEISQKFGDIKTSARVGRHTGLRIQIMIQTNQRSAWEKLRAFGDHRVGIAPDFQIKAAADFGHGFLKTSDALVVIFEDKNRFHVSISAGNICPSPGFRMRCLKHFNCQRQFLIRGRIADAVKIQVASGYVFQLERPINRHQWIDE
ncbi:MAG TPA: hypothetical protein VNN22_13990 [Verrucomicrobiae bacterium]|nr:hypothetical protein [Verrucomicrobiae bacterium]